MKVCTHCNKLLPYTAFAKQSTGKQGLRADCKECHKAYGYTEEGVTKAMYANQKSKSKKRGHVLPNYTWEQFHAWCISQPNWTLLFNAWVASGHLKDLKPSGDRLDDYQSYTLNNLQLVTTKQNLDRYRNDAIQGINTKTCVPVSQYTLDGVFVKKHHSVSEAARVVGDTATNIRMAAQNKEIKRKNPDGTYRIEVRKQCKGFRWKFED